MDLVEYARRVQGYEVRPLDGGRGIVVLEHPALRDRIAVAQSADGRWLFAGVPDYTPRAREESPDRALARLYECIGRSASRGSLTEFERHAEAMRRRASAELLRDARAERTSPANAPDRSDTARRAASVEPAGRPEPVRGPSWTLDDPRRTGGIPDASSPRDALNRRMHGVRASPGDAGPPTPEQIAARKRDFERSNRAVDAATAGPASGRRPGHVEMFAPFDLVEYARREQGYEVRPRDGGPGITVLENARLQDRVAIARTQDGRWIYADVRGYVPRALDEPADPALARLRECIGRSPSRGSVLEFAVRTEGLRQELAAARPGPSRGEPAQAPMAGAGVGRHPLGIRHYDLKPVALDLGHPGRGLDRGR